VLIIKEYKRVAENHANDATDGKLFFTIPKFTRVALTVYSVNRQLTIPTT